MASASVAPVRFVHLAGVLALVAVLAAPSAQAMDLNGFLRARGELTQVRSAADRIQRADPAS